MCTLAVYLQSFRDYPLVIAANRDEFFDRDSFGPTLVASDPPIYCGRDGVHGGTWLGVNARGVGAALLNRRTNEAPDASLRSRGRLCMDALAHPTAASAVAALGSISADAYNPFNLLVADAAGAWNLTNFGRRLTRTRLEPGLHLLTNLDVDDPECPRIASSTRRFAELLPNGNREPTPEDLVERLQEILSSHDLELDPRDPLPGNSLCVHLESFGTRSSTILLQDARGGWSYRHCGTAPCRGRYRAEPIDAAFAQRSRA